MKKNKTSVSVIVFISPDILDMSSCLESLIQQTFQGFEVFVICTRKLNSAEASILKKNSCFNRLSGKKYTNFLQLSCLKRELGAYVLILSNNYHLNPQMIEILYRKAKVTEAEVVVSGVDVSIEYKNFHVDLVPKKSVFSSVTDPEIILNFTMNTSENKLFKASFLMQNNFNFKGNAVSTLSALVMAKKISYINTPLVSFLGEKMYFRNYLEKKWQHIEIELKNLESFLKKHDKYSEVERSFINYAFETLMMCDMIREPLHQLWQSNFLTNLCNYFCFADYEENYYYSKSIYCERFYQLIQRENYKNKETKGIKEKNAIVEIAQAIIPIDVINKLITNK